MRCGTQQQRALTIDGIVGTETYRQLDEARWRLGDRVRARRYSVGHMLVGDDVATLQQRLLDMGFDCGRVDGILGAATERALRDFQRNYGLRADGTCGPATFRALDRLARTVVGGHPHAMRESELIHRSGPALAGKVVVIDPGHGGGDPGVVAQATRRSRRRLGLGPAPRRPAVRARRPGLPRPAGLDGDGPVPEERRACVRQRHLRRPGHLAPSGPQRQLRHARGARDVPPAAAANRPGLRLPHRREAAGLVQRELCARAGYGRLLRARQGLAACRDSAGWPRCGSSWAT
ncbi:peptidoglycan-binding domain-containing protein [Yinghuangia aomiensis]